jgi:hypothetical protein
MLRSHYINFLGWNPGVRELQSIFYKPTKDLAEKELL